MRKNWDAKIRRQSKFFIAFLGIELWWFICSTLPKLTAANLPAVFSLKNEIIKLTVAFEQDRLVSETISFVETAAGGQDKPLAQIETDGDFALEVVWTDWSAPGKDNNADNLVVLTRADFLLTDFAVEESAESRQTMYVNMKGIHNPFLLKICYQLDRETNFVRRKISVRDTTFGKHFLNQIFPRKGQINGRGTVTKPGGFGQPAAVSFESFGMFYGIEYPAATNLAHQTDQTSISIECWQEFGERIGAEWIESEWVVLALTPDTNIKKWFMKYVDFIRIASLKPYTLYNSWYDLRAPEMVKDSSHVMNEKNTLQIIELFKKNMIDKYGIQLDAFVLDDGWDVYRSDWILRPTEFPNGLRPISEQLKKYGTNLGIWFGPIGGYSHRDWRIDWMGKHGYELIGDQLCLAGKNYKTLFKKRVVDFVVNDGVGYYKWDGIQFSCSEPDHGHPVGLFSRRAVMEAMIEMCTAVREKNPDIFLNITSGTWLSPWWLKYANQIWMQGYDYGYADVPSISRRDAAITYRDFVLYEDFFKKNLWFPIANLMTHGIIKGNLQKLGGDDEPLDKFTDNALLYFARGVSMWELYISPDLLTDGEWKALAQSIRWAQDRFPILKNSEMIGGDPGEQKAYGHLHFDGDRGILAVRNPVIEPQKISVEFSTAYGITPTACSLVLERVYPTRWISPELYSAGATVEILLDGYETAVFEIYPLEKATEPLLAGVTFEAEFKEKYLLRIYEKSSKVKLLNPETVEKISTGEEKVELQNFINNIATPLQPVIVQKADVLKTKSVTAVSARFNLEPSVKSATLALLLEPAENGQREFDPAVSFYLNKKLVEIKVEKQKNKWGWYLIDLMPGEHSVEIKIGQAEKGQAQLWLICQQEIEAKTLLIQTSVTGKNRPLPPQPLPAGVRKRNIKLKEFRIWE